MVDLFAFLIVLIIILPVVFAIGYGLLIVIMLVAYPFLALFARVRGLDK